MTLTESMQASCPLHAAAGRYVVAEEDATPFAERFAVLQATLEEHFAENAWLNDVIRQRLAAVIVPVG